MRTNIELNEQLLEEAMRLSHAHNKKGAIDMALQHFVAYLKRRDMRMLFGKVKWDGDLKKMRGV